MDNFITFTAYDIANLEADSLLPTVSLTTHQKKNYILNFQNSYEKYIFKTVVYNHLVKYEKIILGPEHERTRKNKK